MSVFRCYSQKMPGFDVEAQGVCKALQEQLGISALKSVAILNRYDADQIDPAVYEQAKGIVFSEPMVDVVYDETFPATDAAVLAVEALPGQFDQRADSCAQCIQLMAGVERPLIAYAKVHVLVGELTEADLAAIRVFNAVYGGCVTSKLFANVRERLSLCYYASSSVDLHKGLLMVTSGIDFDKYEPARDEILAQLDAIRQGDFTEEELQAARKCVCSGLIGLSDSPGALEEFYLTQTLTGLDYGPEEYAALCEMVTKEDVIAVAKSIELDSIYFLRGSEDYEEDEEEDD